MPVMRSPEPQHCHHYFSDRLSRPLGAVSCPHWLWRHCQSQKSGEGIGDTLTSPCLGWHRAAQPSCCQNLAVAFAAPVLVGGSAVGGHEWRWRSGDRRQLGHSSPATVRAAPSPSNRPATAGGTGEKNIF